MIRPLAISLALGCVLVAAASASPLEREAGPTHVYWPETAEEAMAQDVEPLIEIPTACDRRGPHYCTPTQSLRARMPTVIIPPVICDGKGCPEEITYGPPTDQAYSLVLLATGGAASRASAASSSLAWTSGGWSSGGDRSGSVREGDVVSNRWVTIYEKRVVVNKWPPELPESPAPVPLPASWLMMLAGLCGLGWMRRRT